MRRYKHHAASILSLALALPIAAAEPPATASAPAPAAPQAASAAPVFRITFDPAALSEPYTGRLYLALAKEPDPEPRLTLGRWTGGPTILAIDVRGINADDAVLMDASAQSFPTSLAQLEPGTYFAQAVARRSPDSPKPGRGPGDLYSDPVEVRIGPPDPATPPNIPVELRLTKVVTEAPFRETERVKLFEMTSPALSAFHGREVKVRAGVVLPEGWADDPTKSWPVVYFITGFGGDHTQAHRIERPIGAARAGVDCIIVVPDPTFYRGHTVFADSDTNGPWGRALVDELIPALEQRFRADGAAGRRYLTGISSGGWSVLWLQMTYPDRFAGCWSHVPDPVDFRDFQRIDMYKPRSNMYRDEHGERRPLARRGADQVFMWYDDFVRQETIMGPGGQIHAFEAVFSERAADGAPVPVFDRATGEVDADATKAWERYDIRLQLERRWPELAPKLAGKLHIYAGEHDTFYLEGATRLLKASLESLGSDAVVEIVPGMGHAIHAPGLEAMWERIRRDSEE